MAPVLVVTGDTVAAAVEGAFSTANGKDVTPVGIPVSVPALMAAAVVDSLLEAAIAAIFEATGFVPADADGVVLLIDELELMPEPAVTPELPFELTSCPAEVGQAAAAPEGEADGDAVGVPAEVAGAAGAAVDPSRGTAAAAPVEPTFM